MESRSIYQIYVGRPDLVWNYLKCYAVTCNMKKKCKLYNSLTNADATNETKNETISPHTSLKGKQLRLEGF